MKTMTLEEHQRRPIYRPSANYEIVWMAADQSLFENTTEGISKEQSSVCSITGFLKETAFCLFRRKDTVNNDTTHGHTQTNAAESETILCQPPARATSRQATGVPPVSSAPKHTDRHFTESILYQYETTV